MMVDPLRLAIALVPLAAYGFVLTWINARRRTFLTSGGCDLLALGIAFSGLIFVGPLDLFRPESATRSFGNFIWLFLLLFYGLWLVLVVLLGRPRLVVYNIRHDEIHPVLAEIASRLDPAARWAGNHLSLPGLNVQLHLDSFELMRNVSLVSSGGRQSIEGWRRLSTELGPALGKIRVRRNPRAVGFLAISIALLTASIWQLLGHPEAVTQAWNEIFAF